MSAHQAVDVDAELAQLLREQEQFLNQKKKPAAKVLRRGNAPQVSASKTSENASEDAPKVLRGVVERNVPSVGQQSFVLTPNKRESSGFPVVKRRGPGQSLFGRRRREEKAANAQETTKEPLDKEKSDIDAANRAKLQEMSPQEILEMQQELLGSLDPLLVEKLKNRRKKSEKKEVFTTKENKKIVIGQSVMKEEEKQMEKEEMIKSLAAVETEEELKQQAKLLSVEERAKLDWTQSSGKTKKTVKSKKKRRSTVEDPTLERFDLDGQLLEATNAELPVHSGLFHHGDDPDAAGYTVPELLHLARSSVASQRAMALTVLAKILRKRQLQANASLPVAPRVLPREMAITLRIVLDDQNYTALSAGVSALHSFIVPVQSEAGLLEENYLPELKQGTVVLPSKVHVHRIGVAESRQEVVYIDTSEADDGSSISDEDLAALDPIQALLHMDIGARMRYILETIQLPDQFATEKMLEILITVARHSPRAAHEINSNGRLLKLLQQQYIENEQVLTFQEGNIRALQLTVKALELVRTLCQGQRSVASALISSGLIQSTKGFLALKEIPTGQVDEQTVVLFTKMQVESLRIWRILLGFGLDFHCFAYLFPVLSGFTQNASDVSMTRNIALFAALEAFCGLGAVHEAQHYFNQLSFFVDSAKDEVFRCLRSLSSVSEFTDVKTVVMLSTALRFLSAASIHTTKYNLETSGLVQVLKLLQSHEVTRDLLLGLNETVEKRDLLLAILHFQRQLVRHNLLPDDMDDDEVMEVFSRDMKSPLLLAATSAVDSSSAIFSLTLIQACELILFLGELITGYEDYTKTNTELAQKVYHHALILVERLGSGSEFLIAQLFAGVLFHPKMLQLLDVFREEADATRMSRVLIPIYQALVNVSQDQETHSTQIFTGVSTVDKFSYHLRLPQEEQIYIPSNLPLPNFWMVCPLSRIEYSNDGKLSMDVGPTRAQSDEMKLIVSATCRFVFELERLSPQLSSISSIAELQPEDKLFHLVHVFFAGSEVLFDDHVDAALGQLLPKLVQPMLRSEDSRIFYNGVLRNLKRIQSIESGEEMDVTSVNSAETFSSDERQVLTFVEKLMAEFTASSFGNKHFAQCVTLLLTRDFPLELRKFVWKELQESRLLHTLTLFKDSSEELFKRCVYAGASPSVDVKLLQLMQQAVCKQQISPSRGGFAYSVAIHHLVVYLFIDDKSSLSSERQHFAQTLVLEASPTVWRHLLSYEPSNNRLLSEENGVVQVERLVKLRTQAAFSSDELLAFETIVSLVGNTSF